MTLVPLKLYFNEKGRAKVELALARGKKLHDKRETEKKRELGARARPAAARQGLTVRQSVRKPLHAVDGRALTKS